MFYCFVIALPMLSGVRWGGLKQWSRKQPTHGIVHDCLHFASLLTNIHCQAPVSRAALLKKLRDRLNLDKAQWRYMLCGCAHFAMPEQHCQRGLPSAVIIKMGCIACAVILYASGCFPLKSICILVWSIYSHLQFRPDFYATRVVTHSVVRIFAYHRALSFSALCA